MKIVILNSLLILALLIQSCDKVKNPYPKQYVDIDTTLIFGMNLENYKNTLWPTFSNNTNTNVNVLIEDFTGHQCVNCPNAALAAEAIESANPDRVFIASIHSGANGPTYFQDFEYAPFTTNFTNAEGLTISKEITDGGFSGNPSGTNNRKNFGGFKFQNFGSWSSNVSSILTANDLKVNLQSKLNYFPQTRGVLLHTEIELKQSVANDLYQVVYVIEDTLVSPQSVPANWNIPGNIDYNYVHRDIMRGCIDGKALGQKLIPAMKVDKNGKPTQGEKYYINYSYKIPNIYDEKNLHFLIYVYDGLSKEILQVIKQDI